jgi:hypothetical protein
LRKLYPPPPAYRPPGLASHGRDAVQFGGSGKGETLATAPGELLRPRSGVATAFLASPTRLARHRDRQSLWLAEFTVGFRRLGAGALIIVRIASPAGQGCGPGIPLPKAVALVGAQVPEPIDPPGRPAHLEPIDSSRCTQPDPESRVAGREVAAAAVTLRHLAGSGRFDNHSDAHAIAVRPGPRERGMVGDCGGSSVAPAKS